MRKNAIFWFLIVAMLLGVFSTPVAAKGAPYTLSLERKTYAPGERMRVQVAVMTTGDGQPVYVLVVPYDRPSSEYVRISEPIVRGKIVQTSIAAPDAAGSYHLCIVNSSGSVLKKTAYPFTVSASIAPYSSAIAMNLEEKSFAPGATIFVSATGVMAAELANHAAIFLCLPGQGHKEYLQKSQLHTTSSWGNRCYFDAPATVGTYELRIYSDGDFPCAVTFVSKTTIDVVDITLDKPYYKGGDTIRVAVQGVTSQTISENAFVGIYEGRAALDDPKSYKYLKNEGANTLDFAMPKPDGYYEMRFYGNSARASSLIKTIPFSSGNVPTTMTMHLSSYRYRPGATAIVTVENILPFDVDSKACVHLSSYEQSNASYYDHQQIRTTGKVTLNFTVPMENDSYEMQLYLNCDGVTEPTFVTACGFAVSDYNNPWRRPDGDFVLTKRFLAPGETVMVNLGDIRELAASVKDARVVLTRTDQANIENVMALALESLNAQSLTINAPLQAGDYELRIYADSDTGTDMLLATPFTVENSKRMLPELSKSSDIIEEEPGVSDIDLEALGIDLDVFLSVEELQRLESSGVLAQLELNSGSGTIQKPVLPKRGLTVQSVATGVKLSWSSATDALAYRVYRSTKQGTEGISVTDFALTVIDFVDVNVDANTTYYYSLRAVLKEATVTGESEHLSDPTAQISVTTGASILGGNASESGNKVKNVVLMKLDDAMMSLNGVSQEIDPGRGTAPQLINGRTFMPIRAVIEAMGGKIGWEEAASKIILEANEHVVTMWLNQKDLLVDGASKEMDVAPVSVNGRTMVPVRFAAENVGCVVDWIASTSEIVIVFYS